MPDLYIVEKKIRIEIIIAFFAVIVIISLFSGVFIYNYIQKKKLSSIYDYMALSDYNNATFIFKNLYDKYPLDENVLRAGIDVYYDMLVRGENIKVASENIINCSKQLLISKKVLKNKWLIYQRLGSAYQKLHPSYYQEAYDAYKKAIDLGDTRVSTIIDLALICYNIGRFEDSIYYIENALNSEEPISPEYDIKLKYELAKSYRGNKNYTKAIQILSSLYGKPTEDNNLKTGILYDLGELYYTQGLYTESEFFYKKALENSAKNPNIYYSIGVLYKAMNRKSESLAMFREAVKVDRTHQKSLDALRRF